MRVRRLGGAFGAVKVVVLDRQTVLARVLAQQHAARADIETPQRRQGAVVVVVLCASARRRVDTSGLGRRPVERVRLA